MDEETREMIIDKALRMIWSQSDPHRYQPRAIGEGPGWEVWDFMEDRAVSLDELVMMMPDDVRQIIAN